MSDQGTKAMAECIRNTTKLNSLALIFSGYEWSWHGFLRGERIILLILDV